LLQYHKSLEIESTSRGQPVCLLSLRQKQFCPVIPDQSLLDLFLSMTDMPQAFLAVFFSLPVIALFLVKI